MSNKNLLNESQVRQFMKLARLEPLTPGFVGGLTERGSKAGDEGSVKAGKKDDTDYSGGGEREGDESETHSGEDLEEGAKEELEELRTGKTGALGPKNGTANPGHGRGQGEAADGSLFQEEEDPAELEGDIAHDLGDDSVEGDEEALGDEAEIDAELAPAEDAAPEGAMVDVDQFMDILKTALESAVSEITGEPTEVEVADDVGEVEDEMDADVDAAEEMEMDVEMSAEDEEDPLQEETTNELVERITKRVAARILKSALTAKK